MAGMRLSLRISVILGSVMSMVLVMVSAESDLKSWKSESTERSDNSLVCSEVEQMFVMKEIGTADMVPRSPVRGENLEICKSESTCCTKEMEEKYRKAVKSDFLHIVHATSSHVKNSIATNVAKLQDNFLDMIRAAENNTNLLFSETYPRLWPEVQLPISQLFAAMTSFMKNQQETDLEESVSLLFDSLFPLVYRHNINPKMADLTDTYKECLQETQDEIRPFGEVGRKLGVHVAKSLKSARVLLEALNVGTETMNMTDHLQVSPQCERALVRHTYCPQCRGLVSAKPCAGYCLNVVHGCLAGVAEMEQPWNDFVSALERLTLGMKGVFNAEEVMGKMNGSISDAIMHAMVNGPEITKKVKRVCGQPQRSPKDLSSYEGSSTPEVPDTPVVVPSRSSSSTPSLYVRLQELMKSLSPSKNFFSALADTLCNDDKLKTNTEGSCWNGENVGEYTKTIVGFGMSAQKHNPEVEASQLVDQKITGLVEKLKRARQSLMARVTLMPESDSLVNDGSGSGWPQGYNPNHDDEDFGSEDGSASGHYTDEAINRRTDARPSHKWTSQKPGSDDEDLQIDDSLLRPGNAKDGKSVRDGEKAKPDSASRQPAETAVMALSLLIATVLSSLWSRSWLF